MEFTEAIRRRRMVRRYAERTVPADVRDRLVDVALRAPSAGFSQGVSLLVLEAAGDRERFWTATTEQPDTDGARAPGGRWLDGMRPAPLLIIIWTSRQHYLQRYAEPDKGWTDEDESRWAAPFWYVDAGMAAMNLLLAVVDAQDREPGLGACFFGVPPARVGAVRASFGVPADQLVVGVVSVGYRAADEQPSGSPRHRARRPSNDMVHRNRW